MSFDDEWLEIKYIGKHEKNYVKPPKKAASEETQWVYTPSGRICANMRDASNYSLLSDMTVRLYVFEFIDLVSKVCFEMEIVTAYDLTSSMVSDGIPELDSYKFVSFYFSSEHEMVVIAAASHFVKLLVYKVDYGEQSLQLKETIFYELMKRSDDSRYYNSTVNFVCVDKIDYIVLVGGHEELRLDGEWEPIWICMICMIPRYPAEPGVNAKEFQVHEPDDDGIIENKVRLLMGTKSELSDAYELLVDDVLYFSEETYFNHFEQDGGLLILFRNNKDYAKDTSVTLLYPSKAGDLGKSIVLSCVISHERADWKCRYTLHPHGALLNFAFSKRMYIYVRVMKFLKLNLKSLALSKALFHKDTPIRYHIAYRLCFNREKPIEYKDNNDVQQALKQFLETFNPE